jgi:hypothetical protein
MPANGGPPRIRVMFRLARDLGGENPVSLRTLTDHAF